MKTKRMDLTETHQNKVWNNKESIGGSRGGMPGARPPKGPDPFVSTHKIFEK